MTSKANQAKLRAQEKMRRGELMGHVDPEWARRRYLDEAALIDDLAAECGVSVIQMRRYLQAHGIKRDRGYLYRAGVKVQPKKGRRKPGSRRDSNSRARFMSDEHRAKLAAAKRGRRGPESNRWRGGHEIGGYVQVGGGSSRRYVHRELAEKLLGRALSSDEHVHHIDRNRKNNSLDNLLVLSSAAHTRLHLAMRKNENLDQRAWLVENSIPFEDLSLYA